MPRSRSMHHSFDYLDHLQLIGLASLAANSIDCICYAPALHLYQRHQSYKSITPRHYQDQTSDYKLLSYKKLKLKIKASSQVSWLAWAIAVTIPGLKAVCIRLQVQSLCKDGMQIPGNRKSTNNRVFRTTIMSFQWETKDLPLCMSLVGKALKLAESLSPLLHLLEGNWYQDDSHLRQVAKCAVARGLGREEITITYQVSLLSLPFRIEKS